MANVRNFGATGDGITDDTQAIRHAIADGDGEVFFPPGRYRITQTIAVDLTKPKYFSLAGAEGTAQIIMSGPGPALRLTGSHRGSALPATVQPAVWQNERFPCIRGIEILGDHEKADGIQLVRTMQVTVTQTCIRNVGVAIHLSERNRNFLLTGSHLYDNREIGVFFDRCNIHQAIISGNHISYNKHAGIKSLGGDLHNLQITGNDIEYNYAADQTGAADLYFDAQEGIASEITISSNTIQAVPSNGGANLRVIGKPGPRPDTARLITVTGNVLGSQETNLDLSFVDRITVTGNTIYSGRKISVDARDCQHFVIGNNSFAWNHPSQKDVIGGLTLTQCKLGTVNGLIFDSSKKGDRNRGGTIELVRCDKVNVANCQINDPKACGIWIEQSKYCLVSDNTVLAENESGARSMNSAIRCDGATNRVQNNLVQRGQKAAIDFPEASDVEQLNAVL